ncbi:MAG: hypothetical protein CMO54_11150 [Verrucomicrobiales bacterium]|nr:hypothetical protein [Verrucomicrobiales bacterium]
MPSMIRIYLQLEFKNHYPFKANSLREKNKILSLTNRIVKNNDIIKIIYLNFINVKQLSSIRVICIQLTV